MHDIAQKTATDTRQLPALIVEVLDTFKDVFELPKGLPPKRSCDHRIILKEGASPPNIRPYRMPHTQKNVVSIRKQIKLMLRVDLRGIAGEGDED